MDQNQNLIQTPSVLHFKDITEKFLPLAGGKGKVLAYLFQKKYPVPEGLIIFPSAFVEDELKNDAKELLLSNLKKIHDHQKSHINFAVRSSALSEDSAKASFAGEFETVLNVDTDENIIEAVKKVRLSRYSKQVENYSKVEGISGDHEMAVVVQMMIPSEIAGVIFTAEPITGDTCKITGNYVKSLGESLVSGDNTGDKFTVERPKMRYTGPAEMKKFALKLAKIAEKIEDDRVCPQDIEWAIAKGQIFILH